MARTIATLPAGSRITDYISLGVIAKFFPVQKVYWRKQAARAYENAICRRTWWCTT